MIGASAQRRKSSRSEKYAWLLESVATWCRFTRHRSEQRLGPEIESETGFRADQLRADTARLSTATAKAPNTGLECSSRTLNGSDPTFRTRSQDQEDEQ